MLGSLIAIAPRGTPRLLADITGMDSDRVAAALVELAESGLVKVVGGVDVAEPGLAEAVASWLGPELVGHRERALEVLEARGAPDVLVAEQLMHLPGQGRPERVAVLERAARVAVARGNPVLATELLTRALEEPPTEHRRVEILRALAEVQAAADHRGAVGHLRQAMALAEPGRERGALGAELATLLLSTDPPEAVAVGQAAVAELGGLDGDRPVEAATAVVSVAVARMLSEPRLDLDDHAEAQIALAATGGGAPAAMLACVRGFEAVMRNEPRDAVTEPLDRVLGTAGVLRSDLVGDPALTFGLMALAAYDDPRVHRHLEIVESAAQTTGSLAASITTAIVSAEVAWGDGDLAAAAATAQRGLDIATDYGIHGAGVGYLAAVLSHTRREQGDLDGAARALREASAAGADATGGIVRLAGIDGAAAALGELGPPADALRGWQDLGRRAESCGAVSPALVPWRSRAAGLLDKIGRPEDAREVAFEAIELARVTGAPRAMGRALRAAGHLVEPTAALPLLEEAYERLESTSFRLDRATSALALGVALHRAGAIGRASALLRSALREGQRCGAGLVVHQTMGIMGQLGIPTGRPTLTKRQHEIATLAAAGRSNADIAAALIVSVRTVETHLANVYAKLGIHRRADLAGALLPEPS